MLWNRALQLSGVASLRRSPSAHGIFQQDVVVYTVFPFGGRLESFGCLKRYGVEAWRDETLETGSLKLRESRDAESG